MSKKIDREPETTATAVGTDSDFLTGTKGVVIRQDFQLGELVAQAVGLPCEKKNRYKIAVLPADKRTIRNQSDKEGWVPTMEEIDNMPYNIFGNENSDCMTNSAFVCLGCPNFRPFDMEVKTDSDSAFALQRPFTCGGVCCCPHTMNVLKNGTVVGKVVEDWNLGNWCCRYVEAAFCCKVPYNVQLMRNGTLENRYNIDVNVCCFGNHNNFCTPTPCFHNSLFDINNYTSAGVDKSSPAGHIQKTYGAKGGAQALGRCCCGDSSQYLLEWPANATSEERAVLVGATFLIEYIFFENRGN